MPEVVTSLHGVPLFGIGKASASSARVAAVDEMRMGNLTRRTSAVRLEAVPSKTASPRFP
jgi:hypothetical protein